MAKKDLHPSDNTKAVAFVLSIKQKPQPTEAEKILIHLGLGGKEERPDDDIRFKHAPTESEGLE